LGWSAIWARLRSSRAERLALTRLLDLYLPFLRSERLELRQGPAGPGVLRVNVSRVVDLATLQRKQLDFSIP
jgi:hypothetical protein